VAEKEEAAIDVDGEKKKGEKKEKLKNSSPIFCKVMAVVFHLPLTGVSFSNMLN